MQASNFPDKNLNQLEFRLRSAHNRASDGKARATILTPSLHLPAGGGDCHGE